MAEVTAPVPSLSIMIPNEEWWVPICSMMLMEPDEVLKWKRSGRSGLVVRDRDDDWGAAVEAGEGEENTGR